jgi:hypothetical protein
MKVKNLPTKVNQFSYFGPSFDLKTRVVTLPQSIVGVLLTIFSVVMVFLTVIEGYDIYTKNENIAVSATKSFAEVSQEVNVSENDFYPILRIKPYFRSNFWTSQELMKKFKFQGEVRTKPPGVTLISSVKFEFEPCSGVSSELKDRILSLASPLKDLIQTEGLCPQVSDEFFKDISLFGNFQSDSFSILSLKVFPCEEVTPGTCDTPDLRESFEVFLTETIHSFNQYDEEEPYKTIVNMN